MAGLGNHASQRNILQKQRPGKDVSSGGGSKDRKCPGGPEVSATLLQEYRGPKVSTACHNERIASHKFKNDLY